MQRECYPPNHYGAGLCDSTFCWDVCYSVLIYVLRARGRAIRGMVAERPDAEGGATQVSIGLYIIDIEKIDDVNQRFSLDVFVRSGWQDPRLALPAEERSGQIRTLPLDDIWNPRILVINDRGLSNHLPRVAEVDDAGNVLVRQRVSGELAVDLQFGEFPFDEQRLPIEIVSYQYSPDELSFALNAKIMGDDESFSVEGWRLRILEPEFDQFVLAGGDGSARPRLTFFIEAERIARYYVLTMFLPMSLIIFMSWMVFWLPPDIVPSRIALSTGAIFSLIAFGFSIRLSLPRVSYMTRADVFVLGCTLLVFLALSVAVIGSRWASREKMSQALRLNAVARWAYVGLFCLVVAVSMIG